MLYIIGLGLGDEKDVTVKGAEAIAKSDRVFLEAYTSILGVSTAKLEETYGKKVELAHRETVESEAETILEPAKTGVVSLLVVGDPFGATTHTDLWLRAKEMGIETRVIHNASIMNAVGACGLQLYSFGQTVSIPYFREDWQPDSWYDKVAANKAVPTAGCCTAAASAGASSGSSAADASALATPDGLHTLCLLDIKVREPNFEAMVRTGRTVYDPPRFMSINEAIEQMLLIEARRGLGLCGPSALAVGVARVGQDSQKIVSGTLAELVQVDFGGPLHSLVLCGGMHELEWAMWRAYRWDGSGPKWVKPAPASSSSRSRSSSEGSQGR